MEADFPHCFYQDVLLELLVRYLDLVNIAFVF